MLRSSDHVTPEVHDGLSANPWLDISVNDVTEAIADPSATEYVESPDSCQHPQSQTNADDPLQSQDDVRGPSGASDGLHETRPSLKKVISTNMDPFQEEGSSSETEITQTEAEVIVHHASTILLGTFPFSLN
jgi:hypothetical protein